ncbi:MAG: hypothetical protein E7374_03495 [Clostridiales bacterium]|nr:hypothetical protein [Clostridiales bacterium]
MGFFSFFKKKKKKQEYKLSEEDLKWNKMWDLWCNGEIESPYRELMEYSGGINNGGHHMHYDNIAGNSNLKEYVDQLVLILPEPLKSNALLAYRTYKDELSGEDIETMDKCDTVFYQNEKLIDDLLKNRASKIEL